MPEEMIMRHLAMLLTSSEPGDALHHLHVVAAPADAIGPLGLPDQDQLDVTVYAIAPDPDVEPVEQFIAKTLMAAAVTAARSDAVILFAAMSQEVWAVSPMDALADRLQRQGRLGEHPDARELTMVYAACRDGRRWRGRRWLSGPQSGASEDVDLLVGQPRPEEAFGMPCARLVRKLVGL